MGSVEASYCRGPFYSYLFKYFFEEEIKVNVSEIRPIMAPFTGLYSQQKAAVASSDGMYHVSFPVCAAIG